MNDNTNEFQNNEDLACECVETTINENNTCNEISIVTKKLILVQTLLKAATMLTDLNDEENKEVLLDLAGKYCDEAEDDYTSNLDQEVLDIIDDVKNMLFEGTD